MQTEKEPMTKLEALMIVIADFQLQKQNQPGEQSPYYDPTLSSHLDMVMAQLEQLRRNLIALNDNLARD